MALRDHYRAFLRDGRVLLTGHSHQAWPDVARDAMVRAFEDAAEHVDDKWGAAFEAAEAVRRGVAARIGAEPGEIALGQNTHELLLRFLSALDYRRRRHLVTTRGEFHTIDRQLHRLAEEGVDISFVEPEPDAIAGAVRDDTAAVLCSTVLFQSAAILPRVDELVAAARARGAEVLLDAYHAFQIVPFRAPAEAFVVGGGYKYAQWGEGNCFLRVPPHAAVLRPIVTGWFAGFAALADPRGEGHVGYPLRAAERFAGSTYDPTSHYRARAVLEFFEAQGMTVEWLRETSLRQTGRILDALGDGFDVITPRDARAGFVAVRVADARAVVEGLRARGVLVDARGDIVRLGPAPYLTDEEIDAGVRAFVAVSRPG